MNKVAVVAAMEVMHRVNNIYFTHRCWPGYNCCWVPNLPTAETSTDPQHWLVTISWGDQPATWWQVDYIGPLPPWKGQCFVLTEVDSYSGMDLLFLHGMLLPKLLSVNLQNAIWTQYRHGLPHSIISDQGTHFSVREVWQWAHTALTMFLTILEHLVS